MRHQKQSPQPPVHHWFKTTNNWLKTLKITIKI